MSGRRGPARSWAPLGSADTGEHVLTCWSLLSHVALLQRLRLEGVWASHWETASDRQMARARPGTQAEQQVQLRGGLAEVS